MSIKKKGHLLPILFLLILFSICIFIVGIKYGESVAKTDTIISYIRKTYPTQKPVPTSEEKIKYITFEAKDCNISFVYPSNLKKTIVANANYLTNSTHGIYYACPPNELKVDLSIKSASVSFSLNESTISAEVGKYDKKITGEQVLFTITHPETKKEISFLVSSELLDLVTNSLKFTDSK